jgi:SAM-dependent methyltransferase
MQERHLNKEIYFREQSATTGRHMIPYLREIMAITPATTILEIGCGEGGNLLPFLEMGCRCVGIDLSPTKIEIGKAKLPFDNLTLICKDIHDVDPLELPPFDLIFSRDVLEHIHGQASFIARVQAFAKPGGVIFFAFPPWRMPFGGHQQNVRNRLLSKLPFYHILPTPLYARLLRLGGETPDCISALLEIKQTGISTRRFNALIKANRYEILKRTYWFINPNYEVKFHLKPRKLRLLRHLPFLRDFFTTCYYCAVRTSTNASTR